MLIGLSTPVLVQTPAAASPWERDAGIEDVARIAETADRLGFDYLTCSEHVAVPVADAAVRGSVYWDPLATFGFLAARTTRIRLATSQQLVAVARLSDGSYWTHTVDVVVTLAACIE